MRDKVVLIITVTVCLVVLLAMVGPMITGTPASSEGRDILGNLVSSLIAIVSFSIGRDAKKEG